MDTLNGQIKWDSILNDIAKEQAVLLLGHGFLPRIQQIIQEKLQAELGDSLLHVYQRDGLFLFEDINAKVSAQGAVTNLYEHCQADEALLRKVAELPFKLIVSANPDKCLTNTFAKYHLPLQFDYFSSKTKDKEYQTERPTAANPLLYNLCGSYEDQESIVLDYDDLFDLLRNLLPNDKLPVSQVRIPLEKAYTYIFIGFHFERWYTQLFLRHLNMRERLNNTSSNYVLKTSFSDADDQQFFMQQFNVKYIGADEVFFDELHQRFSEKHPDKLRKLTDTLSPDATTISMLVAKSEYLQAINQLRVKLTDPADLKILTSTEAEYNEYLKRRQSGTAYPQELEVKLNQVKNNLLTLAQKLQ